MIEKTVIKWTQKQLKKQQISRNCDVAIYAGTVLQYGEMVEVRTAG
jgi:hypothetical protein